MITTQELKTHLYAENIATISRGDDTLLKAAIDGAIVETKGYLTAYDIETIFGAEDGDRNPLLLIFIKDIAVWHFLVLSNAGVELELREKRYDRAIAWLKGVQKGIITPNLPTITEEDGDVSNTTIRTGSNIKRDNHF